MLPYLLTRKLHCTRNYIHMNLFVSFILRAARTLQLDLFPQQIVLLCKVSKVCMEYFVACNYFWLLVEAIFLHTLLFTANSISRFCHVPGTPVLFVTPWTVVKILYENTGCWSIMNRWFWWIIRGPITLSVLVIFFIFIKILMLLLSKLKADQVKFTDYRYSLARATLVLIPLLGIHEVVFTVLIDECMEGSSRYARNFINLTLSSFQGFLVAVLYCFANGEVWFWSQLLLTSHSSQPPTLTLTLKKLELPNQQQTSVSLVTMERCSKPQLPSHFYRKLGSPTTSIIGFEEQQQQVSNAAMVFSKVTQRQYKKHLGLGS
uniref:G-protein coupled receptors family 2 profile 2 domain-containing protein n=1 Tax=Xiphophorus couchianus TaxID=32473 RepID=A0A3B5L0A7_9TELE